MIIRSLVRIVRINIYVKDVLLLLVPTPLQFGARDPGLSYLGSGVRTDLVARGLD